MNDTVTSPNQTGKLYGEGVPPNTPLLPSPCCRNCVFAFLHFCILSETVLDFDFYVFSDI